MLTLYNITCVMRSIAARVRLRPQARGFTTGRGRQVGKLVPGGSTARLHKAGKRFEPPPRATRQGRRIVMALDVNDGISALDPARRRKIEDPAAAFIAEEVMLRELRKARQFAQVSVARQLGISQDGVSRLGQTQRPAALDAAQDGRAHGRKPLADRHLSRPAAGRDLRHRPARVPRLRSGDGVNPACLSTRNSSTRNPCGGTDACSTNATPARIRRSPMSSS